MIWPFNNPLARGTDRVEGVALIVVLLAALLAMPVMLVVGSIVRADLLAESEQDARTRHPAIAVLLEDAPVSTAGYPNIAGGKSYVLARWTRPDARTVTAPVPAGFGLKAGAKVDIWLDRSGRLVDRPLSEADADAGGALVALTGWFAAMVGLALTATGLHLLLACRRSSVWDREWAAVEAGGNNDRR